jgi:transposase InsO family protein
MLKNLKITEIDQVWSTDITYFDFGGVFYYLTFIIDNCSRRILGYHVSSRLNTEHTSLPAITMAIKTRKMVRKGIIFHSDGGGQYYDENFLNFTRKYKFVNSMCEHAWENGIAERVNGIIKNNYLIPWNTRTPQELFKNIDRAVTLYNHDKAHSKLNRMTPVQFEEKNFSLVVRNKSQNHDIISKNGS